MASTNSLGHGRSPLYYAALGNHREVVVTGPKVVERQISLKFVHLIISNHFRTTKCFQLTVERLGAWRIQWRVTDKMIFGSRFCWYRFMILASPSSPRLSWLIEAMQIKASCFTHWRPLVERGPPRNFRNWRPVVAIFCCQMASTSPKPNDIC